MRFPIDVILVCIRWYAAYPLSYRHLEEMMQERGVFVDHSSINRWAIRFLPLLENVFRKHKHPVGGTFYTHNFNAFIIIDIKLTQGGRFDQPSGATLLG